MGSERRSLTQWALTCVPLLSAALILGCKGEKKADDKPVEPPKAGPNTEAGKDGKAAGPGEEKASSANAQATVLPDTSKLVSGFEAITDAICACKDSACADAESKRIDVFVKAQQDTAASKADKGALSAGMMKAARCMAALTKKDAKEKAATGVRGKSALVSRFEAAADTICACTDAACAAAASKTMDRLVEAQGDKEPPKADHKALTAAMMRAGRCATALIKPPQKAAPAPAMP